MSWLDDMHANDPACPAPGTGDPWQAPPTAAWAVLAEPETSWEADLTGGTPWDVPDYVVTGAHSARPGPSFAELKERRWGPGGRVHFADPRPGDFPGRGTRPQPEPETEAEAGR
jgi:hypothetical protein